MAERRIKRALGNLTEIEKYRAVQLFPDRPPQLQRAFNQAEPSERLIGRVQGPKPAPPIAAYALLATGKKPFENGIVLGRAERIGQTELHAAGKHGVPADVDILFRLAGYFKKIILAAPYRARLI